MQRRTEQMVLHLRLLAFFRTWNLEFSHPFVGQKVVEPLTTQGWRFQLDVHAKFVSFFLEVAWFQISTNDLLDIASELIKFLVVIVSDLNDSWVVANHDFRVEPILFELIHLDFSQIGKGFIVFLIAEKHLYRINVSIDIFWALKKSLYLWTQFLTHFWADMSESYA